MSKVVFTSNNPFERAENIRAVYEAYDGDKEFFQTNPWGAQPDFSTGRYALRVADEFPRQTPGKCLFIGHGMGAGKTYGLDQPHPYFHASGSVMLSYCIASSDQMIPYVARQCGIPEDRVLPVGMPRTDAYFQHRKKTGKKTYLYLPTFRCREEDSHWTVDWKYIDEHLSDDEQLIVKPHMVTKHMLNGNYRRIREEPSDIGTTEFLLDADVIITDYSSIMFDSLVCRKPVVLFEKDQEIYLKERGMYCRYPEEYSTYHCRTEESLLDLIRHAEWNDYLETRKEFFAGCCDGHSSERVCSIIRRMLCES